MSRVLQGCQAIAARRPGVAFGKSNGSIHLFRPDDSLWIEIEQAEAIGGSEQIRITEYKWDGFQKHTTCCAWEAITLIEQRLNRRKQ